MKYKSRIGKLACKRKWIDHNNEFKYIIYSKELKFMDKVTKEEYDKLNLPILKINFNKIKK